MRPARLALAGLLLLAACGGRDMDDQQKYEAYEAAALFPDGSAMQPPVAGTVARGDLEALRTLAQRPPMTRALLERGHERYDIFCAPCHGRAGDGQGVVVARGFPAPPSYYGERLRGVAPAHVVDVITNGYGVMYDYAARVPPADRWAIAAYVKALQLSQRAAVAELPADDRHKLWEVEP
jgi:mono/diheme cytochrome c family protein